MWWGEMGREIGGWGVWLGRRVLGRWWRLWRQLEDLCHSELGEGGDIEIKSSERFQASGQHEMKLEPLWICYNCQKAYTAHHWSCPDL